MTFFLNAPPEKPKIKAQNPNVDIPNFLGGLGAAISNSGLGQDANFRTSREIAKTRGDVSVTAADSISPAGIQSMVDKERERITALGLEESDEAIRRRVLRDRRPEYVQMRLDVARAESQANADAWGDVDLSDEGVVASVQEDLQREYEDNQQIIEMMPGGRGIAEFVGGMVGATADVRNLPFLVAGGGAGSIARVAGREAMLNMAAEGVTMPSQMEMAEFLDIPEPDVVTQLTIAGAAGGLLGGGIEAGRRGLILWKNRNNPNQEFSGRSEVETQMLVDEAEDILDGQSVGAIDGVARVAESNVPADPVPPKPSDEMFGPNRPWEDSEDPGIHLRDAPDEGERLRQEAIAEAEKEAPSGSKPLIDYLRRGHEAEGLEGSLKIHPDGDLATELKSIDVTSRSAPGLFSRKGRKSFDDLVADDWEERFPGIIDATRSRDHDLNGYLDPDGFKEVVARSAAGDNDWITTRARVTELERELDEYTRLREEGREVFEPVSDGPNARAEVREIADRIGSGIRLRGLDGLVSQKQQDDMVKELAKNGGSLDDLLDDMDNADLKFAEVDLESDDGRAFAQYTPEAFSERAEPGQPEPGGSRSGRPDQEPGTASGRPGGEGSGPGTTERTDAGQQGVIDGVAPITDLNRLEAAQVAPLRGGNTPADNGLFDVAGRDQTDMFSDPASPEAKVMHDAMADDLSAKIEADGDLEIDLGDGRVRSGQDILNELQADEEFEAVIALCGRSQS